MSRPRGAFVQTCSPRFRPRSCGLPTLTWVRRPPLLLPQRLLQRPHAELRRTNQRLRALREDVVPERARHRSAPPTDGVAEKKDRVIVLLGGDIGVETRVVVMTPLHQGLTPMAASTVPPPPLRLVLTLMVLRRAHNNLCPPCQALWARYLSRTHPQHLRRIQVKAFCSNPSYRKSRLISSALSSCLRCLRVPQRSRVRN